MGPNACISVDETGGYIEGVARDPSDPVFNRTMLFIAFVIALRHHGRFHLHAASLAASDGRGVVLIGPSGAGKSTTCVALRESGFSALADDAVFLRSSADGAAVVAR